jgi:hypothetical protein
LRNQLADALRDLWPVVGGDRVLLLEDEERVVNYVERFLMRTCG